MIIGNEDRGSSVDDQGRFPRNVFGPDARALSLQVIGAAVYADSSRGGVALDKEVGARSTGVTDWPWSRPDLRGANDAQ